jgi:hypothetical protein
LEFIILWRTRPTISRNLFEGGFEVFNNFLDKNVKGGKTIGFVLT